MVRPPCSRSRAPEAAGGPAYIVFPDRTLIEMAETRPRTLDEMARIGGVGAKKLERYGAAFLEVIAGAGAGAASVTIETPPDQPPGGVPRWKSDRVRSKPLSAPSPIINH